MNKKAVFAIVVIILGVFGAYRAGIFPKNSPDATGTLADMRASGEIIIGTHATYPPFESINEKGEFIGLDIEIGKLIAKDLGVTPVFKNIVWEQLFDAVRGKEIDMAISSITITKERSETMGFSDPYINAGQVIVTTPEKSAAIAKPEDLAKSRTGVQTKTTSATETAKYTSLITNFKNYNEAKDALIAGSIDAMVMDYPAAVALTTKDKRTVIASGIFSQEFYGIATHKDETSLQTQINKTIRRLKQEGTLKALEERWLSQ